MLPPGRGGAGGGRAGRAGLLAASCGQGGQRRPQTHHLGGLQEIPPVQPTLELDDGLAAEKILFHTGVKVAGVEGRPLRAATFTTLIGLLP